MKPITPDEIPAAKATALPVEVLDEWNKIIAEKYSGGSAEILQSEIVGRIVVRMKTAGKKVTRQQVFDNGWVDIEPIFRKAGWKVDYDKPGYCETYEATFTFSKKRKG